MMMTLLPRQQRNWCSKRPLLVTWVHTFLSLCIERLLGVRSAVHGAAVEREQAHNGQTGSSPEGVYEHKRYVAIDDV